ncbi:hypothetical protein K1719_044627 [Acacia pycnantha]|nr:hypothetical protein K1719_044627 [Acacia pycnantha]
MAKGISDAATPLYDSANKVTGLADKLQTVTAHLLHFIGAEFEKLAKQISSSFQTCLQAQQESTAKLTEEVQSLQAHVHLLDMSLEGLALKKFYQSAAPASTSAPVSTPLPLSDPSPSAIAWKLADKVAAAGYYVVVPDFFHGDPFVREKADRPLSVWIKDHAPEKSIEAAKPVIEAFKGKGVSAIGATGFCWGAKVVVEVARHKLINTVVLLHPSFVSVDDIKSMLFK